METQCVRKIVTKLLHIILIYLMHHSIPATICHQGKIKGLYETTRESIKGFVLTCLKSNILQDVCVEGGGAVSGQLRVAVSREDFKKNFQGSRTSLIAKLLSKF